MEHEMGLYPLSFEQLRSGEKRREYRLFDEKRRRIRPGDTIVFVNTDTRERLRARVLERRVFSDFRSCYEAFWEADFAGRYSDAAQAVEDTYANWWPKAAEAAYGCVVFRLEPVK